ncbi:MAG: thioredoxin [Bacteroidales bacterium]
MILYEAGTGNIIAYILSGVVVGYILYNFFMAKKRMNKPPSENVAILSDDNFDNAIKSGVALVDFWAAWCGPCRVLGPIVDEIADEIGDKAKICKVDVDKNQQTARKYGIRNIPTVLLFKDGKPVDKFVGVKPKGVLIKSINSYL